MSEVSCPECGARTFTVCGWADLDRCSSCGSELSSAGDAAGPIVVGQDGRSGGADALALAHLLASRDHRDLVIVSAQFGSPVRALIEAALANGAGTIVIGSSHRSLPGRVLPGSVGSRLLCDSPCSIALAPAGFSITAKHRLERVGVAYDGSPESKLALREGIATARSFGSALCLVTAIDQPELVGAGWGGAAPLTVVDDDVRRIRREAAELDLAAAIETIPAGLDADAEALEGPAATVVVAASRRFDLLVLGSRSHGPIRRVLVGSVSGPVSRSAHCPLLITPRSAVMARPAPGEPGLLRLRPPRQGPGQRRLTAAHAKPERG